MLGVVKTSFIGTADNLADILIKPVSVKILFNNLIFGRGTIVYCVALVRTVEQSRTRITISVLCRKCNLRWSVEVSS